jgi:thioredoxin reductase
MSDGTNKATSRLTLGERAETIDKQEDGSFIATSNKGTEIASVVAIAGGLGSFEPRKPYDGINFYEEDKGVKYFIKDRKNLEIKESLSLAVETLFRLVSSCRYCF